MKNGMRISIKKHGMLFLIVCFSFITNNLNAGLYDGSDDESGLYFIKPYGLYEEDSKAIEFGSLKTSSLADSPVSTLPSANMEKNRYLAESKNARELTWDEISNRLEAVRDEASRDPGSVDAARKFIILNNEQRRRAKNFKVSIETAGAELLRENQLLSTDERSAKLKEIIVFFLDYSTPGKAALSRDNEQIIMRMHNLGWSYHIVYGNQSDKYVIPGGIMKAAVSMTADQSGMLASSFGVAEVPAAAAYIPESRNYCKLYEGKEDTDSLVMDALAFYRNYKDGVRYPVLREVVK